MATNTSRLGLLKKDTATDGNDTFNIKTMLNDNWDKIDAKVATLGPDGKVPADQVNIPALADASTTQKGVVQLEDSVTSTSTSKAATPNSVKTVNDAVVAHKADLASQATGKGASLIGIEDSASQFTATTVEGALTELFTSVSNGKTQVANAITQKGQTASGSDTFAQLAAAISNLSGVQKYEANVTGSTSTLLFTSASTTNSISAGYISVSNIGFTPKLAVLRLTNGTSTEYVTIVGFGSPSYSGATAVYSPAVTGSSNTVTVYNVKCDVGNASFNASSVIIPTYNAAMSGKLIILGW